MTTPTNSIEELYSVLSEQLQAYHQLIELAHQERVALENEDISRLTETIHTKERVAESIAHWDDTRAKITASLAVQLELPHTASLSDIIAQLDNTSLSLRQEVKQGLNDIRQEFANLLEQLLFLYNGNRKLLEAGLARVNTTFDYISSATSSSDGQYTSKGRNLVAVQCAGNVLNWKA